MGSQSIKKSFLVVFWSRTIQIIVNLFIVLGMAGIGYLIWVYLARDDNTSSSVFTAVLISKIVLFLPLIFGAIVKY